MSKRTFARWRAAAAGITFAVAALAGSIVPAISVHAATQAANVVATWNTNTAAIDVTWTGTGVPGDTYSIQVGANGDPGVVAGLNAGAPITGLTTTQASVTGYAGASGPQSFVPGDQWRVNVTTTSSDSTTAVKSAGYVTIGQGTGTTAFASAPQNLSVSTTTNGSTTSTTVTWGAPATTGTTPYTGWSITASKDDGTSSVTFPAYMIQSATSYQIMSSQYQFTPGQKYLVTVAAINGTAGVSPNSAQTTFAYALSGGGAGSDPTLNLPTNNSSFVLFSDLSASTGGLTSFFNGSTSGTQSLVLGYMDTSGSTPIAGSSQMRV